MAALELTSTSKNPRARDFVSRYPFHYRKARRPRGGIIRAAEGAGGTLFGQPGDIIWAAEGAGGRAGHFTASSDTPDDPPPGLGAPPPAEPPGPLGTRKPLWTQGALG